MSHTTPERQQVYLMCRALFSGIDAQLRQKRPVRKVLIKNRSSLLPLFQGMGEEQLIVTVQSLLESRVFESDLRAKVMFPDLFRTTPQRDAEREASEVDAAKSVANALEEITQSEDDNHNLNPAVDAAQPNEQPAETCEGSKDSTIPSCPPPPAVPSLYPSYFPYSTQHAILTTAQRVLEECCFEFASRWLPDFVKEKGWDCASAVELTKWGQILDKKMPKLPSHAIAISGSSIKAVLVPTHNLRHTAVHRLPTTARGVSQMLAFALKSADALKDLTRAAQLEELMSEVNEKIKTMELTKNDLENRTLTQLEEIRCQREELDRQETGLIDGMVKDDRDHKTLIGRLLEASVEDIFGGRRSRAEETEETSGADFDEEVRVEKLEGVNSINEETGRVAQEVLCEGQVIEEV